MQSKRVELGETPTLKGWSEEEQAVKEPVFLWAFSFVCLFCFVLMKRKGRKRTRK